MSYELLDVASPPALRSYLSIIPLIIAIYPLPTPAYLSSSTPANRISFEPNREVHRWVSTALYRAALISSRQQGSIDQTLRILRTYHAYAASWPSSFRPNQRHRMLSLYLTALAAGLPDNNVPTTTPFLLSGAHKSFPARITWSKEATLAIRDGQRLLDQTTTFPRAGSVNRPVRSFTNLCVALADRSPALVGTVIEILWWSMSLTFQSQSVLRHLTRLLHRKDQDIDAKRTFELYVQLVLKSRETAQPESSLHLEESPSDNTHNLSSRLSGEEATTSVEGEIKEGMDREEIEAETDDDEQFVTALIVGVRVISRELGNLEEGWRHACLARDVVAKSTPGSISSTVRAEVEEVLGVVRMAMATTTSAYTSSHGAAAD
jgi:hypothetical protein